MNLLKKYYSLLPLLIIIVQLAIQQNINFHPTLNPYSDQNEFQNSLIDYFHTAKIYPLNLTVNNYRNEIEFYLQNEDQKSYKIILSTQKDALKQVTALQKLIKIANIKGNDIKFIDLSSRRPYATF